MKKILIFSLLIASTLTACGGGANATPANPPSVEQSDAQPSPLPAGTTAELPTSTETSAPAAGSSSTTISFANNVMPIFNASCVKCHGVEQVKEGLDMTTYDKLMAGSFNGVVITPGDPANSLLIELIVEGKMPKRDPKLTAEEIQVISGWVAQGALNN